jgi:hypothetical protein
MTGMRLAGVGSSPKLASEPDSSVLVGEKLRVGQLVAAKDLRAGKHFVEPKRDIPQFLSVLSAY